MFARNIPMHSAILVEKYIYKQ